MNIKNDWATKLKPDKAAALMLARREVSVLVHDAVRLEGINFTLPEVQTLLNGVTVGGHRISDQQITTNQGAAWHVLFDWVERGIFSISADLACQLHDIAGKEEALKWGVFRSGMVTIAGTSYLPPNPDILSEVFIDLVKSLSSYNDVYDQAIHVFLDMARHQYFYDVNNRMGRFMMNGVLLSHGYPAINLPAKRQLEFNQLMLDFYNTGDELAMNNFMRSCVDSRLEKIMAG